MHDKAARRRNEALRETKSCLREGKEALMLLLQDFASPSPGFNSLIFLVILFRTLN